MNNDTLLRRTGYLTFLLSGVCAISSGIIVSFLQDLHGLSFGVTGSLLSMMNIGSIGGIIMPAIIGAVADSAGLHAGMLCNLVPCAGIMLLSLLMLRKK